MVATALNALKASVAGTTGVATAANVDGHLIRPSDRATWQVIRAAV